MSNNVFTAEDYNSPDGMLTSVWGPPLWHVLHTISFNYPVEPTKKQMVDYYNFYMNLKNILPCRYCRDNLANNLKKIPLNKKVMKNRDSLSRWVYNLHETINMMLGKKSNLTYEMVRDRYEHFRSRCLTDKKEDMKHTSNKEKGCTKSLYGVKGKCVLKIVPKDKNVESFKMDPKCKVKRK